MTTVAHACLVGWKERRQDRSAENHWKAIETRRSLNRWQQYQKDWNFIEDRYGPEPSNNGLDPANPAFAYDTKLAKFIVVKQVPV